ncbi:AMP-binding protein [Nocardia sp. NPDC052112]|uniref:AMP-binding protein n=1 Tax=Nocardia sp. NPDC052112 TaxID=3155646 RepID=UPI003415F00E
MTDTVPVGTSTGATFGWSPIDKPQAEQVRANLIDYDRACLEFSWEQARSELAGLPDGGLNIAYEAVDRHAVGPARDTPALRWLPAAGGEVVLTYAELAVATNRFANVLRGIGIRRGERVCVLLGRTPELYIAVLGALKAGCVVGGLLGVRPQVTTTPAADHRASDGAVGARFLNTIAELLQHPEQL